MKKRLPFFIVSLCLASGVFGAEFLTSAGAGGLFGYNFTRYTLKAEKNAGGNILLNQSMDRINYGALLFFDISYAELSVIIQWGNNSYREVMDEKPTNGSWSTLTNDTGTGTELSLGFTLLGKYPFKISEKITWFPLLGLEYQIALLEWRNPNGDSHVYDRTEGELGADKDKDGKPYPLHAWNSLWIDLGAGLDYTLTGPFYLRSELLFGFRLQTLYETGALEMTKKVFNASDPKLSGLTGGPTLKICAGYKF